MSGTVEGSTDCELTDEKIDKSKMWIYNTCTSGSFELQNNKGEIKDEDKNEFICFTENSYKGKLQTFVFGWNYIANIKTSTVII